MDSNLEIKAFDSFLAERGLKFEAVVIGGAALNLLKIVSRKTKDCDVLVPLIPVEIAESARVFAAKRRADGRAVSNDWFNNGPQSLAALLPPDWKSRLVQVFAGDALRLSCLGRSDLLCSKLFALCDRGTDLEDCQALNPTLAELETARPWVEYQDANPQWPAHVLSVFQNLSKSLGHES